jgi:hypothetical protein
VHNTLNNKTWLSEWSQVINLPAGLGLRELRFGLVPAVVLHALAEKVSQLEVLQAEHISDCCDEDKWYELLAGSS